MLPASGLIRRGPLWCGQCRGGGRDGCHSRRGSTFRLSQAELKSDLRSPSAAFLIAFFGDRAADPFSCGRTSLAIRDCGLSHEHRSNPAACLTESLSVVRDISNLRQLFMRQSLLRQRFSFGFRCEPDQQHSCDIDAANVTACDRISPFQSGIRLVMIDKCEQ